MGEPHIEHIASQDAPHPAVFIPEILASIFSHLDLWDLASGLGACSSWRSTLACRVTRLTLPPLRAGSDGSAEFAVMLDGLLHKSWLRAVSLFANASCVALHLTQTPGPPQGGADTDGGQRAAAQTALQGLLSRATSLELALVPSPQPRRGITAAPRGHASPDQLHPQQQHHYQPVEVLYCVAALCSASALPALCSVERLLVWGGGCCFLTPNTAGPSLWELLPALTHLDLAADGAEAGDGLLHGGADVGRGPALGDALGALLRRPLGAIAATAATRSSCGGGGPGAAPEAAAPHAAPLDLATAQALFACLPRHLRHLSASVSVGETDRMAAWAGALSGLPPGLTSLRLLGPLCHSPDLAAAVASWAEGLPSLRRLELGLAECCHSHPDLEAQLYDDPDSWTSSCWHGVFPALTQLRALQISMESITDGVWCDTRSCSHLTCLRLHPTSWSGMCEAVGIGALTSLSELALTVSEPSELQEVSTLAQLTRLDLEMLGLQDGDSGDEVGANSPAFVSRPRRGLLHRVTSGLSQLRRLHISCRSVPIDAGELGLLEGCCPVLSHLQIRAPFRPPSPAGPCSRAALLPQRLRLLELANTHQEPLAAMPVIKLAGLPAELLTLSIEGMDVELLGVHGSSNSDGDARGRAGGNGGPRRGPCTLAVRAIRCTLRCMLAQLCGRSLRSLDLSGTALHGVPPPGTGDVVSDGSCTGSSSGESGLGGLRGRCQLRRLGLWGSAGQLRPFNDAGLHELVQRHPRLRELALNAGAATRSGLWALAQLTELRSLEVSVSGQECAATLGMALAPLTGFSRLEVVIPVLNFAGDCIRDHLAWTLPSASVRLRAQQAGE